MKFDFFGGEWFGACGACGAELFALSKSEYQMLYSRHTHSKECLGGY